MELEIVDGILRIDTLLTVTLGIVVLFVGKRLNNAIPLLREFSIPEPVTECHCEGFRFANIRYEVGSCHGKISAPP